MRPNNSTLPLLNGPNSPIRSPVKKACVWTVEEECKFLAGLQVHKLDFDSIHALQLPSKSIQELHQHFHFLRRDLAHPCPRNDTPLMREMKATIDSLEAETIRDNKENLWPSVNLYKEPTPPPTAQEQEQVQELIQKVHLYIEKAFHFHLTKEEVVFLLREHCLIEPVVTRTVWEKLEEQNPAFFQQYSERLQQRHQLQALTMDLIFSSPRRS